MTSQHCCYHHTPEAILTCVCFLSGLHPPASSLVLKVLDGKEEVEQQHRENIRRLSGVVERQEKDSAHLQLEAEDLQERNRSLQVTLDNAYK